VRHRFAAGALAALTQAAGLTALAGQSAAQAAPAGRVFHVGCAAAPQGSAGSRQHPWTALAEANAHTYCPGDRLLFRRGAVCTGTLAPLGTGAHRAPFTIVDYGNSPDRARIDGSFDAAWSGPRTPRLGPLSCRAARKGPARATSQQGPCRASSAAVPSSPDRSADTWARALYRSCSSGRRLLRPGGVAGHQDRIALPGREPPRETPLRCGRRAGQSTKRRESVSRTRVGCEPPAHMIVRSNSPELLN